MSLLRRFALRLLNFLRPGRAERQLAREVASHLALLEEEFRRRGMNADEARVAARRAFGGIEQTKEMQRDARSFGWLEDCRRDVGYAVRTLRRAPSFTLVATATLALGIGSATVIYSLLHNVLLEPFPYTAPRRMVDVVVRDAANNVFRGPLGADEFLDYQKERDIFEDAAGTITESMYYLGETGAERMSVGWGTPNMFTFLGVRPLHGRHFGPADAASDAPAVAVLNHRTWRTTFGGDLGIIGRTVRLNGIPRTVIGIMPPRFEWHVADFWIPAAINRALPSSEVRSVRWFQARLRPGVTVEEAEARLKAVAARRAADVPQDYPAGSRVQVITIIDWVAGQFRFVLYTLFGAVSLLLVIACCNVANMLLARATVREHEIAVRTAIGASRSRIVRQLLVESVVLAQGGLAGGILLAYGGIALLARFLPRQGVAWEVAIELDRPVLAFAAAAGAVATLLFGVAPAWHATRRDLLPSAQGGARSGTANRRQQRLRSGLVVAEVALSFVLLAGAGLLARSFLHLVSVDTGLGTDPRHLFAASVAFPPEASVGEQEVFWPEALARLQMIPGIRSVAVSNGLFGGQLSAFSLPGTVPGTEPPRTLIQFGNEALAETLGLRLTIGRGMSAADMAGARKVAVVNETMVRQNFRGENPIGRLLRLDRLAAPPFSMADPTFEVIGVVRDVANTGVRSRPMPHVYVPYVLRGPVGLQVFLSTSGDASLLSTVVRDQVRAVNPRVALVNPRSVATQFDQGIYAQPRFSLFVLLLFAGAGLGLLALGVYGVISYNVAQQTREFAIRMALGGDRRHILGQVLRTTVRLVGTGAILGLGAGLLSARLLTTQLWNVQPNDPLTFGAAVAIVLSIGGIACAVPARRATRVQPATALRHE